MSTSDNATCRSLSFWLAVILGVLGFLLAWKWLGWGAILSLIAGVVVLLVLWFVLQRALCGEDAAGDAGVSSGTAPGATTSASPAAAPAATPEPAPTTRPAPAPVTSETAAPAAAKEAPAAGPSDAPSDAAGTASGDAEGDGTRPPALDAPRNGKADDLKKIKGIGPALERQLNELGIWHFDQIAAWTPEQVAWIDGNLVRFKGRATRDGWVEQARILASGGETEFSKRVDKGDVY